MKKHIFILIRYNVLSESNRGWVIGREVSFEDYKKTLFDTQRLDFHQKLFFELTIPSIKQMDSDTVTTLIYTSTELPAERLKALENEIEGIDNIKICQVGRQDDLAYKMRASVKDEIISFGDDVCFATVRIDDDDAFAVGFDQELSRYLLPHFNQMAVSFSGGIRGFYQDGEFIRYDYENRPKRSQGMALISYYDKNKDLESRLPIVYSLGNHTRIDEKRPVILDGRAPMVFCTIHRESDSQRDRFDATLRRSSQNPSCVPSDLPKYFPMFRDKYVGLKLSSDKKNIFNSSQDIYRVITRHGNYLAYDAESMELATLSKEELNTSTLKFIYFNKASRSLVSEDGKYIQFADAQQVLVSNDRAINCDSIDSFMAGVSIFIISQDGFLSVRKNEVFGIKPSRSGWETFELEQV